SRKRWEQYTKAKEVMLQRTHIPEAPWWIVPGNDKKKARLNCIHHLLTQVKYTDIAHPPVRLPKRVHHPDYSRKRLPEEIHIPQIY
ncbi:MAG: hypothetical protein KIT44_04695, partial [Opitutaceae bacterium]|nr:hypothetical protein [Opitutaceae bacterium]